MISAHVTWAPMATQASGRLTRSRPLCRRDGRDHCCERPARVQRLGCRRTALPRACSAAVAFRLETADCFAGQVSASAATLDALDWARLNPATGAVFVEGAGAGDVLSVSLECIEVAPRGVMAVSPGFGVLGERVLAPVFAIVPIADGVAHLLGGVAVPLRPMIGVIGVAPAGAPVPCGSPGRHGGNMDTRLIGEGAVVYLPVAARGALLAAGVCTPPWATGSTAPAWRSRGA